MDDVTQPPSEWDRIRDSTATKFPDVHGQLRKLKEDRKDPKTDDEREWARLVELGRGKYSGIIGDNKCD